MAVPKPDIGNWYRRTGGGELFEVVAVDEDDGTLEIQYFDGTVEEMDIEDWETQWEDGAIEAVWIIGQAVTIFAPMLIKAGMTEDMLRHILVDNPRRFLAFVPRLEQDRRRFERQAGDRA